LGLQVVIPDRELDMLVGVVPPEVVLGSLGLIEEGTEALLAKVVQVARIR
jgi:hypothetical protein